MSKTLHILQFTNKYVTSTGSFAFLKPASVELSAARRTRASSLFCIVRRPFCFHHPVCESIQNSSYCYKMKPISWVQRSKLRICIKTDTPPCDTRALTEIQKCTCERASGRETTERTAARFSHKALGLRDFVFPPPCDCGLCSSGLLCSVGW